MKQISYTEPKTKWQLAVSIEQLAEELKKPLWGSKRNMTIHYDAFTKAELKTMYENLKQELVEKINNVVENIIS